MLTTNLQRTAQGSVGQRPEAAFALTPRHERRSLSQRALYRSPRGMRMNPIARLLGVALMCAALLGLPACGTTPSTGAGLQADTGAVAGDAASDAAPLPSDTSSSKDIASDGSADTTSTTSAADTAVPAIQAQIDALTIDKTVGNWRSKLKKPTKVAFTTGKNYFWLLHTNKGDLKLALRPDVAPMHVTSTIYLTLLGFYDSLLFHRILKGFMAQGGDPLGTGMGGPGYKYALEVSATAKHDAAGVLSMANAGQFTEGSQFFITFAAQPSLDGGYSVFGKVVSGMDTLKAIEAEGTESEGTPGKVQILSATIQVE